MIYRDWNRALGEWLFRPEFADEEVFLATDDETLLAAANGFSRTCEFADAEAAGRDFVLAVRAKTRNGRNWDFPKRESGGPPECLGLLVFQVYAALSMADDDKWSAKAYWPRVKSLLGMSTGGAQYPGELDTEIQQRLWRDVLQDWLNDDDFNGGSLGVLTLPPEEGHKNIKLPLSQALLRAEDLYRLPLFFQQCNLIAGEAVSVHTLDRMHGQEFSNAQLFSRHALRVFADDKRRPAAIEQVCQYLAQWDGSLVTKRHRDRARPLRVWCNYVSRRRRKRFAGGMAHRSSDGLWSQDKDISIDMALAFGGPQLPEGTTYKSFYPNFKLLVWQEAFGAYLEMRAASPGDTIIILTRGHTVNHFRSGLRHVCRADEDFEKDIPGLPREWYLLRIQDFRPPSNAPWPWNLLVNTEEIGLRLVGGLKLTRSVWMEGSGPRVELSGRDLPDRVWVDGQRVNTIGNSVISPLLSQVGVHNVWLPGARARRVSFKVSAPRVRHKDPEPWVRQEKGWPKRQGVFPQNSGSFLGQLIEGDWPPLEVPITARPSTDRYEDRVDEQDADQRRLLVKLIVAHRKKLPSILSPDEFESLAQSSHPLVKVLLRGVTEAEVSAK